MDLRIQEMFQSRFQDSLNCDRRLRCPMQSKGNLFQSRFQDSLNCNFTIAFLLVAMILVSVPFPGFTQLQPNRSRAMGNAHRHVSVPFPGFTQLQRHLPLLLSLYLRGFSPVSRIHSIATPDGDVATNSNVVSVPFPGFTQLQREIRFGSLSWLESFSPVSRIHSIATE